MPLIPIDDNGLLVGRETGGYGVDPVPTATDFVRISERAWLNVPEEWEYPNERDQTAGGDILGAPPAIPRGRVVSLNAPVELRGSGTEDVPPEDGDALRACGLVETITPITSVAYARGISGHDSLTVYAFAGGLRYIVRGMRGTFVVELRGGEVAIRRFQLQGIMVDNPTEVAVPVIDYSMVNGSAAPASPLTVVDLTCTVAGQQLDVESVTFTQGADVQRVRSAAVNNGLDGLKIAIPRMRPTIAIMAKRESLASYNPWADNKANTARTIQVRLGTAGGERVTIDVATAYIRAPGKEDQSGFAGVGLTYKCMDFQLTHD